MGLTWLTSKVLVLFFMVSFFIRVSFFFRVCCLVSLSTKTLGFFDMFETSEELKDIKSSMLFYEAVYL